MPSDAVTRLLRGIIHLEEGYELTFFYNTHERDLLLRLDEIAALPEEEQKGALESLITTLKASGEK